MTVVAVVVPVMRRPQNAARFMQTFAVSDADATVYAIADVDDVDTIVAWQTAGATVQISERGPKFANKVQHGYLNTTEPWLLLVGDDVVFHSGWQQAALAVAGDRYHLVATNDMGNPWVMSGQHATHPMLRRSYVDEVGASWDGPGHIAHEGYRHAWCDNENAWKARRDDVFVFAEDARIEHMHPTWSKGEMDDVYRTGIAALQADGKLFHHRARLAGFEWESNLGKWDRAYANAGSDPAPYGDSDSYLFAAAALANCETVEDWGCGLGWFRTYLPDSIRYIGVDGSRSPHADVIDDLATRRSQVDGIFMRHVLEHNYDWPTLLDNALASFTKRMVLVTFTPFTEQTPHEELRFEDDYGVPTLALNHDLIVNHLVGFDWEQTEIESPRTFYGHETMFTIDR